MKKVAALRPLKTARFTLGFNETRKDIDLDGTQPNFLEAMDTVSEFYKKVPVIKDAPDASGSSDDDFSHVQENHEEKNHAYVWSPDTLNPEARRTTITCSDGNVKGNQLVTWTRDYIQHFLKAHRGEYTGSALTRCAIDFPGRYFAISAGKFAKYKTNIDSTQSFSPGDYVFGKSKVKVTLTDEERLVITDPHLQKWLVEDLELPITRWDLPYRGYTSKGTVVIGIKEILDRIREKIISHSAPKERLVPDNELGTIQLYCAFPDSYPLGEGPYRDILSQGALHKFLDFFNALIFGVEASRNNTVFLTGLLSLLNMRYGSSTSQTGARTGPFSYDNLLDIFPLAVTGTGSGNFVAEKVLVQSTQMADENKAILSGRVPVGFSFFRDNSQWLKVTVKSAILIYTWLADHGVVEGAPEIPVRGTPKKKPSKSMKSLSISSDETFVSQLQENLYETLSHHYERGGLE